MGCTLRDILLLSEFYSENSASGSDYWPDGISSASNQLDQPSQLSQKTSALGLTNLSFHTLPSAREHGTGQKDMPLPAAAPS